MDVLCCVSSRTDAIAPQQLLKYAPWYSAQTLGWFSAAIARFAFKAIDKLNRRDFDRDIPDITQRNGILTISAQIVRL